LPGRICTGVVDYFFAGFLEMFDGQVAPSADRVTAFGAFNTTQPWNRYAEMALYIGLLVYTRSAAGPFMW